MSLFRASYVFRGFIRKNIHLSKKKYTSFIALKKEPPIADVYCTGSDQMWNSYWNQGVEKSFFLEFAPKHKRRIAFATSIGVTKLEKDEATAIIPMIKKYNFISVREKSAEVLLREYGIKAYTIMDPTLLYNLDSWKKLIGSNKQKSPYLLIYQLHNSHEGSNFDEAAKSIAKILNLKIVRIIYSHSDIKIGHKIYMPTIGDFLSLIYYADYILTDSFHGTAFSINFNKQFSAVYPKKFATRIQNILELTGLEDRKYTKSLVYNQCYQKIDYTPINNFLHKKRSEITTIIQKEVTEECPN